MPLPSGTCSYDAQKVEMSGGVGLRTLTPIKITVICGTEAPCSDSYKVRLIAQRGGFQNFADVSIDYKIFGGNCDTGPECHFYSVDVVPDVLMLRQLKIDVLYVLEG